MEIPPLQRQVRLSDLPVEKLAADSNVSQTDKVAELSRQFEAIFLRQILTEAQKTAFPSQLNPDSTEKGIYQDMITTELAKGISRSGSFGLARSLESQLQQQLKVDTAPKSGADK